MPAWKRIVLRHYREALIALVLCWLVLVLGAVVGWWAPRGFWTGYLVASIFLTVLLNAWARWQREKVVREAPLPQFLKRKLRDTYPGMSTKDCELVERGLRQFFLACLRSNKQFVAMPSRAVDVLWHEFILHTKAYSDWCELALGWFLHHTPAEALGPKASSNDGLRRAWYWACRDEAIQPRDPSRLPLLFALDAKLAIPAGFIYLANCSQFATLGRPADSTTGNPHCATDFADGSYSGNSDSFGGAESSSSDSTSSSSDGGGDGGGCGGGGD
ncbi:MAG: hypothetical protein V4562_11080 [Pseudomonadota bacterium]